MAENSGINFREPLHVEGRWRAGQFGLPNDLRSWAGWVSETKLGRTVVFEHDASREIMDALYGNRTGTAWEYDCTDGCFCAGRIDEAVWQEMCYPMEIVKPDDSTVKTWPIGRGELHWEERQPIRYLPMPDPRFDVTFRPNAVIAIDSDGEVAYFRAKRGPEWVDPAWAHLEFWFKKLPWKPEGVEGTGWEPK
jgi:hypothetical protein